MCRLNDKWQHASPASIVFPTGGFRVWSENEPHLHDKQYVDAFISDREPHEFFELQSDPNRPSTGAPPFDESDSPSIVDRALVDGSSYPILLQL